MPMEMVPMHLDFSDTEKTTDRDSVENLNAAYKTLEGTEWEDQSEVSDCSAQNIMHFPFVVTWAFWSLKQTYLFSRYHGADGVVVLVLSCLLRALRRRPLYLSTFPWRSPSRVSAWLMALWRSTFMSTLILRHCLVARSAMPMKPVGVTIPDGAWSNWLTDWSTDWLIYGLIDRPIDWLIPWLIDWLIDSLIDSLIDWLVDWLMLLYLLLFLSETFERLSYYFIFFTQWIVSFQGWSVMDSRDPRRTYPMSFASVSSKVAVCWTVTTSPCTFESWTLSATTEVMRRICCRCAHAVLSSNLTYVFAIFSISLSFMDFGRFWWALVSFDGFWLVLMGFDGCWWVLMGFDGCWLVLMGFVI